MNHSITYLRKGRKLRATGEVIWSDGNGLRKVKPAREGWGCVVVTAEEIEAGKAKGPPIERKQPAKPAEPVKRTRKPKPAPVPRWKQLVAIVRAANSDSRLFGAITLNLVVELADELEKARGEFLPLNANVEARCEVLPNPSDG